MTYATKLARVLAGEIGPARDACRTLADVDGTVAAYRAACGLTAQEQAEVALVRATLGKAEAQK